MAEELDQILEFLMSTPFFEGDDPAIPALYTPGTAPLCVVAGENAGGKSFFRRLVQEYFGYPTENTLYDEKYEVIRVSMEDRGTGGFMNGMIRAMIYGDEKYRSTGENSSSVLETSFKTSRNREKRHAIFYDEPDVGASAGVSAGFGQRLREFMEHKPENLICAFVVSHSEHLLRQLIPLDPSFVCLGDVLVPTLQEWIDREPQPFLPEEVKERSHARFKRIQELLK